MALYIYCLQKYLIIFIINENNATATDIETLGEIVRKKVFEKTGKKLKWEIKIVGEK